MALVDRQIRALLRHVAQRLAETVDSGDIPVERVPDEEGVMFTGRYKMRDPETGEVFEVWADITFSEAESISPRSDD